MLVEISRENVVNKLSKMLIEGNSSVVILPNDPICILININ